LNKAKFFDQPRGVRLIAATEFWERFSYYGFVGLAALFMAADPANGGLGMDKGFTLKLFGVAVGMMFMAPSVGGWIADRWARKNPRARPYMGLIGALASIVPLFITLLVTNTQLALLFLLPYNILTTLWLGPTVAIIQELVPPAMRSMASAVFLFIVTIIGLGAGPQVVGILNDLIGTRDAIRYSLLSIAVIMNIVSAWYFWRTAQTLAQDMEAKKKM